MSNDSPYARTYSFYRAAGWEGTLPLPRGLKHPPPAGWTGWAGPMPEDFHCAGWAYEDPQYEGANIALRPPRGVLGIDADTYKPAGAATLAALEERLGPLPPTWISSARTDGSGIRWYRVPHDVPGWHSKAGEGVELVHYGHRYAVVWPSTNPDAGGTEYRWYRQPGGGVGTLLDVPGPSCFPELPEAWVAALRADAPGEKARLADGEALAWLEGVREGPECPRVGAVAAEAVRTMHSSQASRYDTMRDAVRAIVGFGGEGHAGVPAALLRLRGGYFAATAAERRNTAGEWDRSLRGAIGLEAAKRLAPAPMCDCGTPGGLSADFFAAPSVADEADGAPTHDMSAVSVPTPETYIDQLLDFDQLDALPNPVPLIRDVLDLDSEAWIIGPSGGFKSFVALDWACHVATGRAWRGKPVEQGEVVYVAAEGAKGIRKRLQAWAIDRGEKPLGVKVLPLNVKAKGPVEYGRQLLSPEWGRLAKTVMVLKPKLIVLDTQARLATGLEENSATAMGLWVEAVRVLREVSGACVLVVHHTGRNGGDARGSTAIDGAQDHEWKVARVGPDRRSMRFRLECDKNKDGDDSGIFEIDMRVVETGVDEAGLPITSLVLGADVSRTDIGVEAAVAAVRAAAGSARTQTLILRVLDLYAGENGTLTRTEVRDAVWRLCDLAGVPEAERPSRDALQSAITRMLGGAAPRLYAEGVSRVGLVASSLLGSDEREFNLASD